MPPPVLTAGGVVPEGVTAEELACRFNPDEQEAISIVRERLSKEIESRPKNAVTSDRRLLRFLRKNNFDVDRTVLTYLDHLEWRKKEKVDAMHDHIIEKQLTPLTIPHGKRVIGLLPQVPCHYEYTDRFGNPLSIEYYGFNPGNVMKVSPEDYMEFFIYSSEYKMLFLDHHSTLCEERMLREARASGRALEPGWGTRALRRFCVIRDLKGFQLSHSMSPRMGFVKELLLMSQNNYPYLTDHTFFVNTPWMFSVVWAVLKTVLSKHTLSKSHILTTAYHDTLMEYIDVSNLPLEFRPEHSGTTAGTGTERGGSSTNHSSALRSGGSTDGTPSETVDEDSSPASSTASSRAGIAIPSNSSSSSNSGRSHGGGSTSSSSVALSPGASEDGAAGQVRSPGKKSSSLFGLSRSREASREVKAMGACGGVSLTVSGIEVQKGSQFQAARLVVQPISSPAVASSSSSSTSGSSSSSSSGRGRTSNSNSGGSGADVSKQSIVQTGPVPLPMQQQLWLDLPLGAGTIRNHVLRLRFSLGLTRAASAGAAKTEPVCLDSTLEVLLDERFAVANLLCWVSFHGVSSSLASLQVLLSYHPPPSSSSSSMKPSSGLRFSLFKSKRKKQPKAPQQQQQNPIQEPYNGIPTKAKQLQPRLPEQTEQNEEGDEDGIELAGELSTDDEIDDVAGEEAASNSGYGTPEGAAAATAAGAGNSDESYMYSFGSMGLEIDDDYVSGFLGTFFQGSDVSVVGTLGSGEMARANAATVDDGEKSEGEASMGSSGYGFSSGHYASSLLGTSAASSGTPVKVEASTGDRNDAEAVATKNDGGDEEYSSASSSLPSLLPSSPSWTSSFFTATGSDSSFSSNVVDEDAAGREVPFEDTSTEWALWVQELDLSVHKFAFGSELSAREAFASWSYVRVLTKRNREVDYVGMVFAPSMGLLREAIDTAHANINGHNTNLPSPPPTTPTIASSEYLAAAAAAVVSSAGASAALSTSSTSSETPGGSNDDHSGAVHGYTAYSCHPPAATGKPSGLLQKEPLAWAIWTYEWFEVRRYGFLNEAAARAALEQWLIVRVLTYREDEVSSRSRWNSDGLDAIRSAIAANK